MPGLGAAAGTTGGSTTHCPGLGADDTTGWRAAAGADASVAAAADAAAADATDVAADSAAAGAAPAGQSSAETPATHPIALAIAKIAPTGAERRARFIE
jgi:hypothetical protein